MKRDPADDFSADMLRSLSATAQGLTMMIDIERWQRLPPREKRRAIELKKRVDTLKESLIKQFGIPEQLLGTIAVDVMIEARRRGITEVQIGREVQNGRKGAMSKQQVWNILRGRIVVGETTQKRLSEWLEKSKAGGFDSHPE